MSLAMIITLVTLIAMLIIGAPVVFAIGTAALSYFLIKPDMLSMLNAYSVKFFNGMDSFVFLCIPMFMLAGELMSQTGMMTRLVKFVRLFVGGLQGGLGYVNVLVSMLFGGVSGSGLADVAALGPIEIAMMEEDGYRTDFSAALTATSAIQGPIIPPSIPMVVFASLTTASVGALFMGGLLPGFLIGLGQCFVIFALRKKKNFPKRMFRLTAKEIKESTLSAVTALIMPVIIIGGIISGIFTATEASAVAVGYALIIAVVVYRNLTWKKLYSCLINTAHMTASIYLIIAFTSVISWILAIERIPTLLNNLVVGSNMSPYLFLFLINLFFLFNGMWISDTAQLLLFAPIFAPIFVNMGGSLIHFGVMMVVNVMISLITPPYGTALYLAASISGCTLKEIVKQTLPFTAVSILVLFLVTYCPPIVTFLPKLMGLM